VNKGTISIFSQIRNICILKCLLGTVYFKAKCEQKRESEGFAKKSQSWDICRSSFVRVKGKRLWWKKD